MNSFIVKAVKLDGMSWPLRSMLQSLDSRELGEAEWWRRMATMQNAAAQAGDGDLLATLDNKRNERYGQRFEEPEVVNSNNLPSLSAEETIKRWFHNLTTEQQTDFLKRAVKKLLVTTNDAGKKNLFSKKQDWMGVYLVLRDRLFCNIMQNDFHNYAKKITPDECPNKLHISSSTMSNFSKTVDAQRAYYKIDPHSFPFYKLCETFWNIIKTLYYADISTNG